MIFLNSACPEKRGKWVVFISKCGRNAVCVFITKGGTLKIYLRVFDKNVALNFVVYSRVGVFGTKKNLRDKNHSRKKLVGKPHLNANHFHDLQLQLSFSNSVLSVVSYYTFRSQNKSDSLLT